MKHVVIGLMFAFVTSACVDNGSRRHYVQSSAPLRCRQFASCGVCTPVLGCGWCTVGNGGMCTDEPNDCAAAKAFQWTWEPSGCPPSNDAGPPVDAPEATDAADDVESPVDGGTDVLEGGDGNTDGEISDAADAVAVD